MSMRDLVLQKVKDYAIKHHEDTSKFDVMDDPDLLDEFSYYVWSECRANE